VSADRPCRRRAVRRAGAQAFEFDTGNPDLAVRWDNTIRYNLGVRVEQRDPKIGNSALSDEGDYSFDKGQTVANRLDILSEFDLVFQKKYGFRVSGAGWYDNAYGDKSRSNPNAPLSQIPSYVNNNYSPLVKRLYHGPSGEIMDAFVFGGVDLGTVPVQAKAGRHTLYWGESLFLGGHMHSIAYSQNPLDLQKGFATPGTEAKELFRPLNQLSAQAQLSDTVSVAAQYLLEWEAARYPEGGTYLGPVDFVFNGPDRQFISNAAASRAVVTRPSRRSAASSACPPAGAPGAGRRTVGSYYRRFADKLPQTLITRGGAERPRTTWSTRPHRPARRELRQEHRRRQRRREFSQRRNTPLNAQVLGVAPGLPAQGETKGPRGDTLHALVNATACCPRRPCSTPPCGRRTAVVPVDQGAQRR
jgi:hypothetical protein